jgi:hypothetical protein
MIPGQDRFDVHRKKALTPEVAPAMARIQVSITR